MEYKYNLHTHTYRCGHGSGDIEDYVKQAEKFGLAELGFAEHTPLPDDWWPEVRMCQKDLREYTENIGVQQKKNPSITILKGLECDYFKEYIGYFCGVEERYELDYLVGSVHAYMLQGKRTILYERMLGHTEMKAYMEQIIGAMECGIFRFVAHPDLFCLQLEHWDNYISDCCKEICREAEILQIPMEINVSGYQKTGKGGKTYPNERFWEIASNYDVLTIVNTDAHNPENLVKDLDRGYALRERFHLRKET